MFVVPRTQPHPPDSSRATLQQGRGVATQRQRGSATAAFTLPQAAASRSSREEGPAPSQRASQNSAALAASANNSSPAAVTAGKLEASGTGMQKLLDTMSSLGMSASGLNISYSEDYVGYPGGGYMNKMINVTAGGKTERFSADLTDKNPMVTAYELQRYFGVAASPGGAIGNVRQS